MIVSGSGGTMQVWRLANSTPVGEPLTRRAGLLLALAVVTSPDGTPVIVGSLGAVRGTVRVWRPTDGTSVGEPHSDLSGRECAALGPLPNGTPVIVSRDLDDGTLQVWRLVDSKPVAKALTGHSGVIAVGALPNRTGHRRPR